MRELVAVVSVLVLCGLGCGSVSTAAPLCVEVVPDAGAAGVACNLSWSCSSDTAHYNLQCSLMNGNFECACLTEGVVGKSFTVNPFPCNNAAAEPAATNGTGCGWTLM